MNTHSRKGHLQSSRKRFVVVLLALVPFSSWHNGGLGLEEVVAQSPVPSLKSEVTNQVICNILTWWGMPEDGSLFCLTWVSGGKSSRHCSWKLQGNYRHTDTWVHAWYCLCPPMIFSPRRLDGMCTWFAINHWLFPRAPVLVQCSFLLLILLFLMLL